MQLQTIQNQICELRGKQVMLDFDELKSLRSQFATSNRSGTRYAPFAFTEQGVPMLSSILKSEIAIEVNIAIMRAFDMNHEKHERHGKYFQTGCTGY